MWSKQVFYNFYRRMIWLLSDIFHEKESYFRPFWIAIWCLGFVLGLLLLGIALGIRALALGLWSFYLYLFVASGVAKLFDIVISFFNWILTPFCTVFDVEEPSALFTIKTLARIPAYVLPLLAILIVWFSHTLTFFLFSNVNTLLLYAFNSLYLGTFMYLWLPTNEQKNDIYENIECFIPTYATLGVMLYDMLFFAPYIGEYTSLTEFGFHDYDVGSLLPEENYKDPSPTDSTAHMWEPEGIQLVQWANLGKNTQSIIQHLAGEDLPVKTFIKTSKRSQRLYPRYLSIAKLLNKLKRTYGIKEKKRGKTLIMKILKRDFVDVDFNKYFRKLRSHYKTLDIFRLAPEQTGKPPKTYERNNPTGWYEPDSDLKLKPKERTIWTYRMSRRKKRNTIFMDYSMGRLYKRKVMRDLAVAMRLALKRRVKPRDDKK